MKSKILFLILLIEYSISGFSSKKGFAQDDNRGLYSTRISSLNVSWFYTWSNKYPSFFPSGINWVAMIWGKNSISDQIVNNLVQMKNNGTIDTLLGFNEPDNSGQSNLTVDQAINLWPKLMSTGLRIGSPAVATNYTWLSEFMNKSKSLGYKVDFIAMHWYGGPNKSYLLSKLKDLWNNYSLPIWITEFSVADWSATSVSKYSINDTLNFMNSIVPALENLTYVERYAWKHRNTTDPNLGPSALYADDGNYTLTALGNLYYTLPNANSNSNLVYVSSQALLSEENITTSQPNFSESKFLFISLFKILVLLFLID